MNERPNCPKCQQEKVVKNGFVKENQRWKCKSCKYEFTRLTPKGKPATMKAMALTLSISGMSFRAIGEFLGVSGNAVSDWVKEHLAQMPPMPTPEKVTVVEYDEIWHFIQKKIKNSGYGLPWIVIPAGFSTGNAGIVMLKPYAS
jgi:transposase